MTDNNIIQSVLRTFKVIKVLSENYEGISLTQLSQQVNLHKSTVSRILRTLKSENLVRQEIESSKYSLGTGFLEISLKYLGGVDLRKISFPYMQKLQEILGETINLAILDYDEIIYIERVVSHQALRHSMKIGDRVPARYTSLGKSMLAFSDQDSVKKMLKEKKLTKNTPYTKTDINALMKEFEEIRHTKIAFDNREHQKNIRCLGSPIFNADGKVVGAISMSGPAVRITDEKISEYGKVIMQTAEEISHELGWKKR
ncbi:MAG: IclR family transcriptional regulator [Anaerolineaceae bacterium]|nr:IclR family transcriptional regulator [Anaerolineaceae bacterium]